MAGPYRYVIGPVIEKSLGGMSFYAPPESCVSWIDLRRLGEQSALSQLGCGFFTMPSGWSIPSGYTWLGGGEGDCRSLYLSPSDQSAWESLIGVRPSRTASTTVMDALDETLTSQADPTGASGPKPLVPGVGEGPPPVAEIILGGHSTVRRKEIAIGGPWWKKLVALHQRDIDEAATRGDVLWRKMLGDMSRKYFGSHDDIRGNQFVSAALKGERAPSNLGARQADRVFARRPETSFAESFDGSDSATLGKDLTWTEVSGTWDNASNRAKELSTRYLFRFARAEHDVSSTDHYAQASITRCADGSSNHVAGVAARFAPSATTCYVAYLQRYYSPDAVVLVKVVSGTLTGLTSASQDYTPPVVAKTHCNGSTIKGYFAEVEKLSVTDTAITTGTRGGLVAYRDLETDYIEFDDWSIADIVNTTCAMPFGNRSTAFNGGKTFQGATIR